MNASVTHGATLIAQHCFSWYFEAIITKVRRIIDEWDTGVKWKISLSFKGIIDIMRSAIAAKREPQRDTCKEAMHGGFRFDWKGVKENDDVAEMVESDADALRVLDHETGYLRPHASYSGSHHQQWQDSLEKSLPTVNSLIHRVAVSGLGDQSIMTHTSSPSMLTG